MINSVTITNHLEESIKMELRFPEKSGFLIFNIEGLGPSKADISILDHGTFDGGTFAVARANKRNIVFTIVLLPSSNIENTRHKLYKYFPIKKRIKIEVETDERTSQIYGYVESNEINIFSKLEATTISVICPDPYFYSSENTITLFAGMAPLFQFPFSNESLTEKLINFSNFVRASESYIDYQGEVETGIVIKISATGTVTNLQIANAKTLEVMSILHDRVVLQLGSGITTGDEVIISTIKGNKYISLIRNGATHNILNCLDKNSDWFQIEPGENLFQFITDEPIPNLYLQIENSVLYSGV